MKINLEEVLHKHKLWLSNESDAPPSEKVKADLRGADLQDASLQNADLRGANLRGADLRGANLRGADLRGANLRDANLRDANLRGADLQSANLWGANLWGANLWGANLWGANLRGASLQDANLRYADLRYADLEGAGIRNCRGNNKETRSAHFLKWDLAWTSDTLAIGCEQHSITDWFNFTDDRIESMDAKALEFWNKHKQLIKQLVEVGKEF